MERQLATIQRIAALAPIEGADKIEVATILGWQVVVKKGEFQVGDYCVYIEIDSLVPEIPQFEFLRERKFRVRTIKLRKQVSQGLALPTYSLLPTGYKHAGEGYDLTDVLRITKYDPQAIVEAAMVQREMRKPVNKVDKWLMRYEWYRNFWYNPTKKAFPDFIAKTDETRVQNIPGVVKSLATERFTNTEKLDGQSATYFVQRVKRRLLRDKYVFGVCSRNWQLLKEDHSSYWTIAKTLDLKRILTNRLKAVDAEFIVLQGEIIGQSIQGNKYKIEGLDFYAFNYRYSNCMYSTLEMERALMTANIKTVPIVDKAYTLPDNVKEIVEYSKGRSVIGVKPIREGVVLRSYEYGQSFKAINPDFLLKHEE